MSSRTHWSFMALTGLMLSSLAFSFSAIAAAGAGSGGGGAQIEAAFRLQGYKLIAQISENSEANALCSADLLQKTLDTTDINVVPTLVDPNNGKPIQDLVDAWTVPGHIQLLQDSWQNLVGVNTHPWRTQESVQVLILHEIYRSTGKCQDDKFLLSEKVYGLLSGQTRSNFSEMFTLAYEFEGAYGSTLTCDKPLAEIGKDSELKAKTANCLKLDSDGWFFMLRKATIWYSDANNKPGVNSQEQDSESVPSSAFSDDIYNQLKNVSPEHPLRLIHDIKYGTWSYFIQ